MPMNIFVLDTDPRRAAEYHADKHVVKMAVEYSQIMSTAARHAGASEPWVAEMYRPTHVGHPCVGWAAHAKNFEWLMDLAHWTGKEYTHRYGKMHKSSGLVPMFRDWYACEGKSLMLKGRTPWVQAMPDEYKGPDAVRAYRTYYTHGKEGIVAWAKARPTPWWYTKGGGHG
jgi:hypothetical protein